MRLSSLTLRFVDFSSLVIFSATLKTSLSVPMGMTTIWVGAMRGGRTKP